MDRAEALRQIGPCPTGHLATVRPDGSPHLVVVTFAVVGDDVVTSVDHKPKTTLELQRITNIEAHPTVSLLVDHYEDDWDLLWWVRLDGTADVVREGARRDEAMSALAEKYRQYRSRPPEGPAIVISPTGVTSWAGTP